ncbi:MAG TPA: translation initiation factor IF-2 [Gemmatimonadaceae bacterium]|nr:translation initiation factor IF-2 [Gemmatimonadaceae bacterium]
MSKLRVQEIAGEFGISPDEVMNLLRAMDVPVRNAATPLTDDQVSRVRARWEREKRARAEKPAPATTRRRRGSTTGAAVETPAPAAAGNGSSAAGRVGRRRAADVQAANDAAAEAEAEAELEELPEELEVELPPPPPARPEPRPEPRAEPVSTANVAPVAPAPVAPTPPPSTRPEPRPEPRAEPANVAPPAPAAPAPQRPSAPSSPPDPNRPRPVVPGAPRPFVPGAPRQQRPAGGSGGYNAPRPVASAAPGGAPNAGGAPPARRDDRGRDDKRPSQQNTPQMGGGGPMSGQGRRKKGKRGAVDQEAVSANINRTMSAMRGPVGRPGARRRFDEGVSREELEAQRAAEAERERKTVRVNEFITVSELAEILKISATQIIGFALKNLGFMVSINQRLDFDQIELIAGEYGFKAVKEAEYAKEADVDAVDDDPTTLVPRPPVVTIMGHVDHGKTSLLDYIRKANVVAGEAGGITQHIGAYHVSLPGGKSITFLDTPGHEAFTAMRARGAQVTDIVVLVVAADDGLMPQTKEAISHARNAGVPIIVAINKIDLPSANVMRVKQDLLAEGVVLEEFGGQVLATPISAKKGTAVETLLDQVLLQAEILDLKANPRRRASGAVIEAQLDPGKGPVATVLVENGTLKVGDDFIVGMYSGRVRALLDERNKPVKAAGPAIPVQVLGIERVPTAGDVLVVVEDATDARETAQKRERLDREARNRRTSARAGVTLEDIMAQTSAGERRTLRIVIKADQGGPAEALADALGQLSTSEVEVQVIHRGVGAVSESDVLLAKASGAIIVGFHVRPDNNARTSAEREGVEIKLYRIIYEAVAEIRSALEGLLRPEQREVIDGDAEVRELFKVAKIGVIAGCSVRSGVINREGRVRVIRNGAEVYTGRIGSLRRFKDDVKEVRAGFECGIGIENFNDLKVGDIIESYRTEERARTLASTT